jgi:hypothetical protein
LCFTIVLVLPKNAPLREKGVDVATAGLALDPVRGIAHQRVRAEAFDQLSHVNDDAPPAGHAGASKIVVEAVQLRDRLPVRF